MTPSDDQSQPEAHSPAFVTLVRVFASIPNARITVLLCLAFTIGFTAFVTITHALDPPLDGYDLDVSIARSFVVVGLAALVPFTSLQVANLPLALSRSGGSLDYAWKLDVPPWKVPTAVMVCALRTFLPWSLVILMLPARAIGADWAPLAGLAVSTVLGVVLWCSVGVALTLTFKRAMIIGFGFVLFDTWVLNLLVNETPLYYLSLLRHSASPFLSLITVSGSDEFDPGRVPDVTPVAIAVPVVIAVTVAALAAASWRVRHLMRATTAGAT